MMALVSLLICFPHTKKLPTTLYFCKISNIGIVVSKLGPSSKVSAIKLFMYNAPLSIL